MSVLAVTGGQYGSEGKGVIAHHYSPVADVAIRVGGPNAGHSIVHEGRVWKMRSIPVAFTNPNTTLVLGPAAIIDPGVLSAEVEELEAAGFKIRDRLYIDKRATILMAEDIIHEQRRDPNLDTTLVDRIGSTGKGIGAARTRRIERLPEAWVTADDQLGLGFHVVDTTRIYRPLAQAPLGGPLVLLEGTQGFGLSLTYGEWPYVTSADCTTMQLLNDCGIGGGPIQTVLVFRSYPIRVAGNSGPLYHETSWAAMSDRLGRDIEERTTVTNKVRRIGEFDWDLANEAIKINNPSMLALTFTDYIDPAVEGVDTLDALTPPIRDFIDQMESRLNVHVGLIGTGGPDWSTVEIPFGRDASIEAVAALLGGGARKREDHDGSRSS